MSDDETTAALSAPAGTREVVALWDDEVVRVPWPSGKPALLLGRGEAADVRLAHASVSRAHARLELGDAGLVVEDLASANGVRVDGVPLAGRAPVQVGSVVHVGGVRVIVRVARAPGPSPMEEVERLVGRFAPSAVSLVLVGETGVGKEVLAERVHAASGRQGPLVRINCAGLAPELLESELFGHERGAFTGAVQAKPGLVEAAHGGTLFLDELGEMPASTQPKLLRVLESGEVRRVGAVRARAVDVRFVSATHRDLRTLAVLGAFREDLLFRLNGFTLRLPPLRERRGEILGLAASFAAAAAARAGRPAPSFSAGAALLLESYRWPGNVRELRNVIERAALLEEHGRLDVAHLVLDPAVGAPSSAAFPPSSSRALVDATPPPSSVGFGPPSSGVELPGERERISRALAEAGGNLSDAAKALGLTPRVLGYRMDKLGLPRPRRR